MEMDRLYALGISVIVTIQQRFSNFEDYFERINDLTNPNHGFTEICPLVSAVDSVFGAQCFVSIATANWANTLLKWTLAEHRPYWWIRETHWYGPLTANKPHLKLTHQTCETGPGSPSGHIMYVTTLCILVSFWMMETVFKASSDELRKKMLYVMFGTSVGVLTVVSMARLFIATHFPHQCFIGFLCGTIVFKMVNNKIVIPTVTPPNTRTSLKTYSPRQPWINFFFAMLVITSFVSLYWVLKYNGVDPQWTILLAFKWCPKVEFIHVSTTPVFSFVEAAGTLLGFALCASPYLQRHRYDSQTSALVISFASTVFFYVTLGQLREAITSNDAAYFYTANLVANAIRVLVFLRVVPFFASVRSWRQRLRARPEPEPPQHYTNIHGQYHDIRSRSL